MAAAEGKEIDSQGAVSFVVSFDNFPAKQVKLPKSLETRKQRQAKSTLTEEILAEKQKKAEERRKKLTEEKIEKLHQLEEEMAGLARKMQAQAEARDRDTASTPAASSSGKETITPSASSSGKETSTPAASSSGKETSTPSASSSKKDADSWSQEAKLAGNHVPNGVKPNGVKF